VPGADNHVWEVPPTLGTIASVGGAFNSQVTVNMLVGGTGLLRVRAVNSCGNSAYRDSNFVFPATAPAGLGLPIGPTTVCIGQTVTYTLSATATPAPITYTWSVPAGWTATTPTTTVNNFCTYVVGGAPGSANITATASNGCAPNAVGTSALITINANPATIGFIGLAGSDTVICTVPSTRTYLVNNLGPGHTYTWTLPPTISFSGPPSTTNSASVIVNGTGFIKVFATNSAGCKSNTDSVFVITTPPGRPDTIQRVVPPAKKVVSDTVCPGIYTYRVDPVPGAQSYTWSLPTGWSFDVSDINNFDNIAILNIPGPGSALPVTLGVSANNACGSSSPLRTADIVVLPNTLTPLGTINGASPVCTGPSQTYTVSPITGATLYTWAVTGGLAIVSGQGTNTIVVSPTAPGPATLQVTASNGGCAPPVSSPVANIVVNTPPQPVDGFCMDDPGTTSPIDTNVCAGTTGVLLSANPVPIIGSLPNTYDWQLPTGWTISSGGGTPNIVVNVGSTAGYQTIRLRVTNACGSSPYIPLRVLVYPQPAQPTSIIPAAGSSLTNICSGSSHQYSVPPVGGATGYEWIIPSCFVSPASGFYTNTIVVTAGTGPCTGTIQVRAINANGCLGPYQTAGINVLQPIGNTLVFNPPLPAFFCKDSLATITINPVSGASHYVWTLPAGWTIVGPNNTNSIQVTVGASSGLLSVAAANSCDTVNLGTPVSVAVNQVPAQPDAISGATTVCPSTAYTYSITGATGATSYTWTLPPGWIGTSIGTTINVTTGSTSGTITVRGNNTCGAGVVRTLAVTVDNPPGIPGSISGPSLVCALQTGLSYTVPVVTGATSYIWNLPTGSGWSPASPITTSSNTLSGVIAGTMGGNLTVAAANGCGSSSVLTYPIVVDNIPAWGAATISGPTTVCAGQSIVYTIVNPPANATGYTWTLPSGWSGTSTGSTITVVSGTSSGLVRVKANNSCGSSPDLTLAVAINPVPATPTTIVGNTVACAGTLDTFEVATVTGATGYTWTLPVGWTITSTFPATSNKIEVIVGALSGTVSVTANNSCGSSLPRTASLTVYTTLPNTPGSVSGPSTVCLGQSQTFSVAPTANTVSYQWDVKENGFGRNWTGSSLSNTILLTAPSTPGVDTIYVRSVNPCGVSAWTQYIVKVETAPGNPASISGNPTPCFGSTEVYVTPTIANATSYIWTLPTGWSGTSSSNTITATVGATGGVITVQAVNPCGVSIVQTGTVTVVNTPTTPVGLTGNTVVCVGSTQTYSVPPVASATSYVWNLPAGWSPASPITTVSPSLTGVVVGPSGGNITVQAVNSCGVSAPLSVAVNVNSPIAGGPISGDTSVCIGATKVYTATSVAGATSYIWQIPAGWNSSSVPTTQTTTGTSITVTVGGNGVLKVTPNNGCAPASTDSIAVSVKPILSTAPGPITGTTTACAGQVITYSVPSDVNATGYVWTVPTGWSGSSTTNTITVTVGSTGGVLIVQSQNPCGLSPAASLPVSVTSLPATPGAISGNTVVCPGSTQIYSVGAVIGATSYTWSFPAGWVGSSVTTVPTNTLTVSSTPSSGVITVKANNACGSSANSILAVAIGSNPMPPVLIKGPDTICTGKNITFTVDTVPGATSYQWTLPAGFTGTSTTNSIIVTPGPGGSPTPIGPLTLQVHSVNACGISLTSTTKNLWVNSVAPSAPVGPITGSLTVCPNKVQTYSVSPVLGATGYTWSFPAGWTGSTTTITPTITVNTGSIGGLLSVTANNACGQSTPLTATLAVIGPAGTPGVISGPIDVCRSSSQVYGIAPVPGADKYIWVLPTGWTITSPTIGTNTTATPSITVAVSATASSGVLSVRASNSCDTSAPRSLSVNIISPPSIPGAISSSTGSLTLCAGQSVSFSVIPVPGATSYNWNFPAGWTVTASTTNTINVIVGATSDSISVQAVNACASSAARKAFVTVQPIPSIPFGTLINGRTTDTICNGGTRVYSIASIPGATSYEWTLPAGWTGSSITNSITTTAGATGGAITVKAKNACGSSVAQSITVTIGVSPNQPGAIVGDTIVCLNDLRNYSISPVPNATSYFWTDTDGIIDTVQLGPSFTFQPQKSGKLRVVAVNACGTSLARELYIRVDSVPPAPGAIRGATLSDPPQQMLCTGSTASYSFPPVPGAVSYSWSLPAGVVGDTITTSPSNTLNIVSGSGGNIEVRAKNRCGWSLLPSVLPITVSGALSQPVIVPLGPTDLCEGKDTIYLNVSLGLGTYTWIRNNTDTLSTTTNSLKVFEPGVYTLIVTNSCGRVPSANSINVSMTRKPAVPKIVVSGGPTRFCAGENVQLTATELLGNYQWYRKIDDTTTIPVFGNSNRVVVQQTGTYYVMAYNRCDSTYSVDSVNVIVDTLLAAPTIVADGPTTFCATDSVRLRAPGNLGTNYRWLRGGRVVGTNDSTYLATISGDYQLEITNACGTVRSSNTITVSVGALPTTDSIQGPVIAEVLQTETYGVRATPGSTYQWEVIGGTQVLGSTTNAIEVRWTSTGIGIVRVQETNVLGCKGPIVELRIDVRQQISTVEAEALAAQIKCYPNPTSDILFISFAGKEQLDIELFDASGKSVANEQLLSGQANSQLDMRGLPAGVYTLRIHNGKAYATQRVIKL
jgi:hypothetical protein